MRCKRKVRGGRNITESKCRAGQRESEIENRNPCRIQMNSQRYTEKGGGGGSGYIKNRFQKQDSRRDKERGMSIAIS